MTRCDVSRLTRRISLASQAVAEYVLRQHDLQHLFQKKKSELLKFVLPLVHECLHEVVA